MFTDRTSIYNHRRPHLAVTTSAPPFGGADASRPRVRFYTVGTLCGSAQPESGQHQFTLCSFLARFLLAAVHRLHTPPFSPDAQLRSRRFSRVSSASSPNPRFSSRSCCTRAWPLVQNRVTAVPDSMSTSPSACLHSVYYPSLFQSSFLLPHFAQKRANKPRSSRSICRHTSCIQ